MELNILFILLSLLILLNPKSQIPNPKSMIPVNSFFLDFPDLSLLKSECE